MPSSPGSRRRKGGQHLHPEPERVRHFSRPVSGPASFAGGCCVTKSLAPGSRRLHIFAIMNLQDLTEHSEAAAGFLKSLASPRRLAILCLLTEGEKSVGTLAAALDAREAAVSQHLAVLRREGLVKGRREGQTIYYSVADSTAREIIDVLHAAYCGKPA